ncbi:7-cyano-7-deazaguanine/7-aminomethyl-7-deazaguanine transporter [Gelidibacter sp. F63206]|uniref:7-cyano-7-deazaguanine/7-aminomethyl-7- deazaguanine transporter n=1 Tax=Gelidibacter sp. F63206 TaxID=2926425 RepID=UPI001FF20DBA|nr:7-cyano-7-deazaguanine/7-aminomethyl-7-deazaguanine transporter [Gelidibacter sp. F63206]MCK0114739.1 7-cyano-7-deazaguanine/7-aminomethyl-7-deazaguanine transporter [Gelidibacter sp. F63206]
MSFTKHSRLVLLLVGFHILIIASSNYLVQFPISVFGFKATWGAFTFPFIFLATDLTVRLFGAQMGRRIVFYAMFPALAVSYFITVAFRQGVWLGFDTLLSFDLFVARIAIASFAAYVVGQILDVFVFNKLREHKQWWHAPLASGVFGNFMDTLTFFFIAFYKTSDTYLAENLVEIATVDYIFKIIISALFFLPLYKVILDRVTKRLKERNL